MCDTVLGVVNISHQQNGWQIVWQKILKVWHCHSMGCENFEDEAISVSGFISGVFGHLWNHYHWNVHWWVIFGKLAHPTWLWNIWVMNALGYTTHAMLIRWYIILYSFFKESCHASPSDSSFWKNLSMHLEKESLKKLFESLTATRTARRIPLMKTLEYSYWTQKEETFVLIFTVSKRSVPK